MSWWRTAAVYQVYIRSFADGNGDGTGDIVGLRSRLDYIQSLGVDAIWINPWYPSPLHDAGYDVADYRSIDPRFGSLAEAELLIAEARDKGIRVIVDLVPNHTSSAHPWFADVSSSEPGSVARGRYIFRDGEGASGEEPPNNWLSVFGGSAWKRVPDGQWYLHLFDAEQPDLNWTNPEVRAEFIDLFEFWLERGVGGFRVDVAHALVKDPEFPNIDGPSNPEDRSQIIDHPYWDQDGVHEIIREWRAKLDQYDDRMMVAEAWVAPTRLPAYLRPDEYHQSFNFDLLEAEWDVLDFARVIETAHKAAVEVGALSTWVLSNHDVMRPRTRYGLPANTNWRKWPATGPHEVLDDVLGLRRARAAAMITMALPGSVYIYQGEELGLPEVWNLPTDVLDDPIWRRSGGAQRGRDGCRVPIPWQSDGDSLGFGDGTSWLPQPDIFRDLAMDQQAGNADSTLELYRTGLALRSKLMTQDESLAMVDLGTDVLAFERGSGVLCVTNFGSTGVSIPEGEVILQSGPIFDGKIPTDVSVWVCDTEIE